MEWYFLKSIAILATLLLFYKLLLEKENMHTFKRFYLLTAVVASIGIPLVTIITYVEPAPGNFEPILFPNTEEVSGVDKRSFTVYLPFILWTIYALGVVFFSLKFIKNLRELLLKIRTNPKIKKGNFTRILLREKVDPHTFFSYIFLNRKKYEQQQIPREVIIHEEAHAQQKHSLDVLFVELLQIIFWMNPLIILLKDAIKLNHEFLADEAVLKNGIQTAGYQNTLLSFSSGHLHSDLVNPINYSSIKKRFTVMKTHTSKSIIWSKGLLILPLISILFFSFSNKEMVEKDHNTVTAPSNSNTLMLEVDETKKIIFQNQQIEISELQSYINNKNYTSYHIEVAENAEPPVIKELIQLMAKNNLEGSVATCTTGNNDQEKATPEMIAEYNRLVKHYNSIPEEEFIMEQKVINRIMYIRSRMTPEQKKKAEKITFDVPPPPPPKPATPPSPPNFEKLLDDGAVFYYEGKTIDAEDARELVEDKKQVNVEITYNNLERPVVNLTDKKIK